MVFTMVKILQWQSGTALLLALGVTSGTIAPLTVTSSAGATPATYSVAQLFPPSNYPASRVAIPAGTQIPVRYDGANKIVVLPTETNDLTLKVARNIRSSSGQLLIPSNSQVKGKLRPADAGSQFVAEELILTDGTSYRLNADSEVVTRTEQIRRTDSGAILKGTAAGAGVATLLSGILGSRKITAPKILLGAGAGALSGWLLGKQTVDVVAIYPNTDLTLTLNSSLVLQ